MLEKIGIALAYFFGGIIALVMIVGLVGLTINLYIDQQYAGAIFMTIVTPVTFNVLWKM